MIEKKCCRCGEVKPASGFSPRKDVASGLNSYCKSCINTAQNARRNATEESRAAHAKRRREQWAGLSPEKKLADGRSRNRKHKGAQKFIYRKVLAGKWPKASVCVLCGSTCNVQWHHDDYNHREEVVELCARTCHPMADATR